MSEQDENVFEYYNREVQKFKGKDELSAVEKIEYLEILLETKKRMVEPMEQLNSALDLYNGFLGVVEEGIREIDAQFSPSGKRLKD